jgi:hypothetical protein
MVGDVVLDVEEALPAPVMGFGTGSSGVICFGWVYLVHCMYKQLDEPARLDILVQMQFFEMKHKLAL